MGPARFFKEIRELPYGFKVVSAPLRNLCEAATHELGRARKIRAPPVCLSWASPWPGVSGDCTRGRANDPVTEEATGQGYQRPDRYAADKPDLEDRLTR